MPYCPTCRYEYRPEIKSCPDCDVVLVDELPETPEFDSLCVVGAYPTPIEAHGARLLLQADGIEAVVLGDTVAAVNPAYVLADGGVKLLVRDTEVQRAQKILRGHEH